jgi:hypothetical protein
VEGRRDLESPDRQRERQALAPRRLHPSCERRDEESEQREPEDRLCRPSPDARTSSPPESTRAMMAPP